MRRKSSLKPIASKFKPAPENQMPIAKVPEKLLSRSTVKLPSILVKHKLKNNLDILPDIVGPGKKKFSNFNF